MIRTAILGYGRNGSTMHAGAIEKLPGFTMAAVCDIDAEARQKAADRFGCPVYADYREMLARGDLDLVVIVTRSSQHAPMAVDALNAGKNVMVTKPWALNEPQALEMIAAAQRNKRLLLPWLPARTACDLIRLKELVSSGAIGRVFQIRRSEYSFGLRSDWQTLREFGGGYLLNWGPHLVDQPLQLAGSPVHHQGCMMPAGTPEALPAAAGLARFHRLFRSPCEPDGSAQAPVGVRGLVPGARTGRPRLCQRAG
ncbi:MAG TPA: Gfo/Idh/MocA family oxidoreductase [Clostridiales bacterium]|nr:Gfo/Idh/MocA family oxidoreductase [Clostridiales bacterium]